MKNKTLLLTAVLGLTSAMALGAQITLLEFDFSGATITAASNIQNSTFNAENIQSSVMSRGEGISNNNANNSFRGTGFSDLGLDLESNRFFEFSLNASSGYHMTVASIFGNFNGTSTYSASPGVTMAYAYSLDQGISFTLMESFTQVGSGSQTFNITPTHSPLLTNVESVTFRLFASGQTSSGGWGLQSASSPGTVALSVDGFVEAIPEPSAALLVLLGVGLFARYLRNKRA